MRGRLCGECSQVPSTKAKEWKEAQTVENKTGGSTCTYFASESCSPLVASHLQAAAHQTVLPPFAPVLPQQRTHEAAQSLNYYCMCMDASSGLNSLLHGPASSTCCGWNAGCAAFSCCDSAATTSSAVGRAAGSSERQASINVAIC